MIVATDGRVRKLHRLDWAGFMSRLLPASVWRRFAQQEQAAGSDAARRANDPRVQWTTRLVLLAYIAMGWSVQVSLEERFRESRELVVKFNKSRRRPGSTYVGLSDVGALLGVEVFHRFWASARRQMARLAGEAWTWKGWVVIAFDGSRQSAPRTKANEQKLGTSSRKKSGPQFWMTWAVHLPTLALWDWRQGAGNSSERSHLLNMLKDLPLMALIVADAGFTGFDFLRAIMRSGRHFLVRCGSNVNLLVEGTTHLIVTKRGQRIVYLWPENHRGEAPLRLRLIECRQGKQKIYLLTSVLQEGDSFQTLSRETAGAIYRTRWGIEVNYRSFKRTMERGTVRARTPDRAAVELAGGILAMGMLRMHAAMVMGAKMARMSVAGVLRVIRWAIEAVRCGLSSVHIAKRLAAEARDDYERSGCKEARDWPQKKTERVPGPPKIRRLTTKELSKIHSAFGPQAALDP